MDFQPKLCNKDIKSHATIPKAFLQPGEEPVRNHIFVATLEFWFGVRSAGII